jgi:hypothetical protein
MSGFVHALSQIVRANGKNICFVWNMSGFVCEMSCFCPDLRTNEDFFIVISKKCRTFIAEFYADMGSQKAVKTRLQNRSRSYPIKQNKSVNRWIRIDCGGDLNPCRVWIFICLHQVIQFVGMQ